MSVLNYQHLISLNISTLAKLFLNGKNSKVKVFKEERSKELTLKFVDYSILVIFWLPFPVYDA